MYNRIGKPVSEIENELAASMGFECILDPPRGGSWCRFRIGEWDVWSLGNGWQVGKQRKGHFHTERFTELSDGRAIVELRDALEYAKARSKGIEVDHLTVKSQGRNVR